MNNKLLAIIAVAVIAIGSFIFVNQDSDSSDSTNSDQQSEQQMSGEGSLVETYPNLDGANIEETVDAENQDEVTVNIDDFVFKTTVLTVSPGTTVTWTNQGDVRHDITTDDDSDITDVKSDLLANGESFSYTFEETGQFDYFCSPHPFQMRGVVVVK